MSFSTIVSGLGFRDAEKSPQMPRTFSQLRPGTASVSIAGDISSQLHAGYSHPLARSWQAERQLTKVSLLALAFIRLSN